MGCRLPRMSDSLLLCGDLMDFVDLGDLRDFGDLRDVRDLGDSGDL